MLIGAKPEAKNSRGVDSDSVAKTALKNTIAPANQQDSITALLPERYLNYSDRTLGATLRAEHYAAFRRPPPTYDKSNGLFNVPIGPTADNLNTDRTLGATLRDEHYAAFRRPPPTYDKSNRFFNVPIGPIADNFNTDRTLGATLRAEHYASFRRPPPNYDKTNRLTNDPTGPTASNFNTDRTLGATLRDEHYAAFRRPPPTRDKHLGVGTSTNNITMTQSAQKNYNMSG